MDFRDLQRMWEEKKQTYGDGAYLYVSELFDEARERHKADYLASRRADRVRAQGRTPDAEQSWKAFKGGNFERLVLHIIQDQLEDIGVRCVRGNALERRSLDPELGEVYRKLVVRYGRWALLPDADLVIYDPSTRDVLGTVSCKVTLRERVAQTAYWKLKFAADPLMMRIRAYFITADEDGDLVRELGNAPSRNRIIVEHELDGTYVLRQVEESERVKSFPKFIDDMRRILGHGKATDS